MLLLAAATCGTASAQYQLQNADFNGTWVDCVPWTSDGNKNKANTQPSDWTVSNIYQKVSIVTVRTELAKKVAGQSGTASDYAVELNNYNMMGRSVPGYMALGTPWATASTKGSNVKEGTTDGGTWGGKAFAGHPDALAFAYKRNNSKGTERATVVAYTWKGHWTQTNVPGNTAVGLTSYGTPTKTTMKDRDVCVLGTYNSAVNLGDAPSHDANAQLIAKLEHYFTESASNWTEIVIPFEYTVENPGEQKVENINIIFSASDYFAGESAVVPDNTFTVDNVKLVYYSELATAKYNDAVVTFTNGAATVDAEYDENLLDLTSNGAAATIEKSYDAATALLTITVKGDNISEDATNKHVYTIQFATPKAKATMSVSAAAGWGTFCAPFAVTPPIGVTAYTVTEVSANGVLNTKSAIVRDPIARVSVIPANTPVVLKSDNDYTNTFEGAAVEGSPVAGLLTGVYTATTAPEGSYVLQNQNSGIGFYLVEPGTVVTVQPNRCYLTLPAGSSARALFFDENDLLTALDNAIIVDEPEAAYDLQGRRVYPEHQSKGVNVAGQKGMLIIGGRKVIK